MKVQKVDFNFFKKLLFLFLIVTIVRNENYAQNSAQSAILEQIFTEYQIIDISTSNVLPTLSLSNDFSKVKIDLQNGATWNLRVKNSNIINDKYHTIIHDGNASRNSNATKAIPMQGYIDGMSNSRVSLTFNENFVYGFLKIGQEIYYIEPLYHFVADAELDKFVVYNVKDVKDKTPFVCGYETDQKELDRVKKSKPESNGSRMPGECFEVIYNTASDWSMRVKYGSVSGVENHNIGVLNDVQTNYDDEFADEIQFIMNEQFVSNCSTCDPWSSTTDAGALLSSFRSWGNGGGFNSDYDLAGLWTNRDLDGGTVGIAYLEAVCSPFRYHVLQDFTSNSNLIRVMVAHEIGHNFNAEHDGSGSPFIMAPAVNNTNTWSAASISDIQSFYGSINCLDNCAGGGSNPTANFNFTVISSCLPGQVQYFDQSTNAVSRSWSFPGGTPSTSTQLNPVVNYNNLGTYNATLTVTSASGSTNSITINNVVTVTAAPLANFTPEVNGNVVTCFFTGSGATSYLWNFGDGFTSTDINPSHTYANDGVYTITLSISSPCGSDMLSQNVTIVTAPTANFTADPQEICKGMAIDFINLSSSNATSYLWTFPGGNPSTSTLENPTVVYPNEGVFNVTLVATNSAGSHTRIINNFITVNGFPNPQFTYTQDINVVTFTNTSTNSTSYMWDFGDGTTSNQQNPVHTYTTNGTYNVWLHASNQCETISLFAQIIIAFPPIASFTSTSTNICQGESITYTNTSVLGPLTVNWHFSGGTPSQSTLFDPTIIYNDYGTFDVRLTATNSFGSDEQFNPMFVQVNPIPIVDFTSVVDGLEVMFSNNSAFGDNFVWTFGDGNTSSEMNPTHTYQSEGTYVVTLLAQNGCGTQVFTKNVIVTFGPVANFSANITSGCNPTTVQFSDLSTPNTTSWAWTFEGGTPGTSTDKNPAVVYANTGSFDVTLIATNAIGSDTFTLSDYIVIITEPTTGFTQLVNENTVNLTNTGFGATTTSWHIVGEGFDETFNGNIVTVILPENGVYTITQTNSNICGDAVSNTQTITINAYTNAQFSITSACSGSPVVLNNTSTNATTYMWSMPGADPETSTDQNPSFTYPDVGSYVITLITSNNLGSDTTTTTVTVQTLPTASFTYGIDYNTVLFTNTSTGFSSVLWNFGDGSTSTETNPSHTYSTSGTYVVTATSTNACGVTVFTQTIDVIFSSTDDVQLKQNTTIMPNPTNGLFTVLLNNVNAQNVQIVVYDMYGRIVIKDNFNTIQSSTSQRILDASHLIDGTYFVNIITPKASITRSLIVQK